MDLQFAKPPLEQIPEKPKNFAKMVEMARSLSSELVFCRIDLYNINGEIKFGEITLHPASGHCPFDTYENDLKVGKMIKLPIE
jgi:hypothetical protein